MDDIEESKGMNQDEANAQQTRRRPRHSEDDGNAEHGDSKSRRRHNVDAAHTQKCSFCINEASLQRLLQKQQAVERRNDEIDWLLHSATEASLEELLIFLKAQHAAATTAAVTPVACRGRSSSSIVVAKKPQVPDTVVPDQCKPQICTSVIDRNTLLMSLSIQDLQRRFTPHLRGAEWEMRNFEYVD